MAKTIDIKEARAKYSLSFNEAQIEKEPLIIEREGEPLAAIIPISEYEKYVTWREEQGWEADRRAYQEAFERERAAFYRLKPQLLETHRGLFVAIHGGKVVDSDADNRELAKRAIKRLGNKPVYIQLVSEELRSFELPSPEVVRRAPL